MQLTYNMSTYDEVLVALPEQEITLAGVPNVSAPIPWTKKKIYGRPSMGIFEIQFAHEDIIYYYSSMSDTYGWGSRVAPPEPEPVPGGDYYTKAETRAMLDLKQNLMEYDDEPTEGSTNILNSDAIWRALQKGGENNVFVATENITSSTDIATAINNKQVVVVTAGDGLPRKVSITASVSGTKVYLHTASLYVDAGSEYPQVERYMVDGTTWTSVGVDVAIKDEVPFVATIGTTTDDEIADAIDACRVIVIKEAEEGKPLRTVVYSSKLSDGIVHLVAPEITVDANMDNRRRPALIAYDIEGSVWMPPYPVEGLVAQDLANIVMTLPAKGIINTRYLLHVTDDSDVGYHLDECIYVNGEWIRISNGDPAVFVATIDTTTAAELKEAINAKKVVYVKAAGDNKPYYPVTQSYVAANNDITLNCSELVYDSIVGEYIPALTVYGIDATTNVWTADAVYVGALVATLDNTSEAALKEAIDERHEILFVEDANSPCYNVIYSEDKGVDGAYIIAAYIGIDTERWNRKRPTFRAYTVKGTTWTASDPLEAVVEDDLANVINSLPATGIEKTRYLLKVPDISVEGYHLEEYIYTENKWICISKDNVVRVKKNVTTEAELTAAIADGKTLLIVNSATASAAVIHSSVGTGHVDLYTVEYDTTSEDVIPSFRRHRVEGAVWTTTVAELGVFFATIDVTTETELKAAIDEQREIIVTTGDEQPYHSAIYAENLGDDGAYVIIACITKDVNRWDRLRPTFKAYTVLGSVWTAADPLEAVVDADLANVVTSLPNAGVAKTRYLLKVPDSTTEGYHLDEYIYDNNKWIAVSRDKIMCATPSVTSASEIEAAIQAGKVIIISRNAETCVSVQQSSIGSGYVDLFTTEYDPAATTVSPKFYRYRVTGSTWATIDTTLGAFVATVDTTTQAELVAAIESEREVLITVDGASYYSTMCVENKGDDGVYLIYAEVVTDTDRWNRRRPIIKAYTVNDNVWTADASISTVIDSDLTNVVTSLPTSGVANTRYLLKVTDTSTQGYHLDEYIYVENKWICISKVQPAPFIATIKVTSQAEIMAAVNSKSPIYIYSDITGTLWPAISAIANMFTATVRYLNVASSSGNYTVNIISYSITGTTWTPTEISLALQSDVDMLYDQLADRRRSLHVLVRKNNDAGQFPMGWVAIVTANTRETYASFCTWLYNKSYRSPETSYGLTGGCCGTTGVRNSADTGTAYVGRITSGAYSTNGTSLCFKFDYNGTVTDIPEARCAIISFPLS